MSDGGALKVSAVEDDQEGAGEGAAGIAEDASGDYAGEDTRVSESAGGADSGGATTGESGEGSGQGGDSQGTTTYEGVSADDFQAYSDLVEVRLDALTASTVVLTFALMMCAGIMAVDKFVGRL